MPLRPNSLCRAPFQKWRCTENTAGACHEQARAPLQGRDWRKLGDDTALSKVLAPGKVGLPSASVSIACCLWHASCDGRSGGPSRAVKRESQGGFRYSGDCRAAVQRCERSAISGGTGGGTASSPLLRGARAGGRSSRSGMLICGSPKR